MTVDAIKRQKVAHVMCKQSLLFFTRYFFKVRFNRKFEVSEHHEIICSALERVLRGECKRLIINIAPRYGKTEIAVKNFIAHGLAINPSAKFIHLSYSDDLALDNSEAVKDLVQEDEYRALHPGVQIKKGSEAKKKWYTTEGGGVYATAAAGQVTGFGAGKVDESEEKEIAAFIEGFSNKQGFAGALIIDDPIKPEDADSEIRRERVNERWDSTISNRVNSCDTPIIVIMQRLHERDLCGYLEENEPGEWEIVSLPSIKADGTALWPMKHSLEDLHKLEKRNPIVFERQHMQNPQPKRGLLFPKNELTFYNPANFDLEANAEFKFFAVDPADDGGDDLAAPFVYLIGDKLYLDHVVYNTDGVDVNQPELIHQILRRKMNAGVIEGNGAWKLMATAVRNGVQGKYEDSEIRVIKNSTNKHTRILAQSSFIKNHICFREDYLHFPQYEKFMKCLMAYLKIQEGTSKNAHDDAPDVLAEVGKYFQTNFGHLF